MAGLLFQLETTMEYASLVGLIMNELEILRFMLTIQILLGILCLAGIFGLMLQIYFLARNNERDHRK